MWRYFGSVSSQYMQTGGYGNRTMQEAGGPEDYASIKARSASAKDVVKVTIPAGGVVIVVVDKE